MTPTVEDDITGLTYEAALAELDTLITKLEGGSIALEEAIGAFERGTLLAQHCAALLERTEQRVNQLVVGADGGIGERPLEAAGAPAVLVLSYGAWQRFFARTDFVPSKTSISRRSRPGSAAPFKDSRPDTPAFMLSTLSTNRVTPAGIAGGGVTAA